MKTIFRHYIYWWDLCAFSVLLLLGAGVLANYSALAAPISELPPSAQTPPRGVSVPQVVCQPTVEPPPETEDDEQESRTNELPPTQPEAVAPIDDLDNPRSVDPAPSPLPRSQDIKHLTEDEVGQMVHQLRDDLEEQVAIQLDVGAVPRDMLADAAQAYVFSSSSVQLVVADGVPLDADASREMLVDHGGVRIRLGRPVSWPSALRTGVEDIGVSPNGEAYMIPSSRLRLLIHLAIATQDLDDSDVCVITLEGSSGRIEVADLQVQEGDN